MPLLCLVVLFCAGMAGSTAAGPPKTTTPCDRPDTKEVLGSFVGAFDSGSFAKLDALFAPEPAFQWYSSPAPGRRLGAAAKRRDTLIPYFRRRHAKGDRFRLLAFDWNGRSAHWSNFAFDLRRSEPGGGGWFSTNGKGAAICDSGAPNLIVLTLGGRPRH
jgi:hypothetical protein